MCVLDRYFLGLVAKIALNGGSLTEEMTQHLHSTRSDSTTPRSYDTLPSTEDGYTILHYIATTVVPNFPLSVIENAVTAILSTTASNALNQTDARGHTPLYLAVASFNDDAVCVLVDAGATVGSDDVDVRDDDVACIGTDADTSDNDGGHEDGSYSEGEDGNEEVDGVGEGEEPSIILPVPPLASEQPIPAEPRTHHHQHQQLSQQLEQQSLQRQRQRERRREKRRRQRQRRQERAVPSSSLHRRPDPLRQPAQVVSLRPRALLSTSGCPGLRQTGRCLSTACTGVHELCAAHMNEYGSCRDTECRKVHFVWKVYVSQSNCPTCMSPIGNSAYQLPCRHIFHRNCLFQWLTHSWLNHSSPHSSSAPCPICRAPYTRISLTTLAGTPVPPVGAPVPGPVSVRSRARARAHARARAVAGVRTGASGGARPWTGAQARVGIRAGAGTSAVGSARARSQARARAAARRSNIVSSAAQRRDGASARVQR